LEGSAHGTPTSVALTHSHIRPHPIPPHLVYQGRAGLLDSDYLGHLNNAAYLTHTELARWQMCAYNGILHTVFANNCAMLLTASAVRYRREIPLFTKFDVECYLAGVDDIRKGVYVMHKFRNHHHHDPTKGGGGNSNNNNNRVRAQVLSRGVLVKNREVMDWRAFLKDAAGIDATVVDRMPLLQETTTAAGSSSRSSSSSSSMDHLLDSFMEMEEAMRNEAAEDDESRIF
jgi:Thioesterase-like superfamily